MESENNSSVYSDELEEVMFPNLTEGAKRLELVNEFEDEYLRSLREKESTNCSTHWKAILWKILFFGVSCLVMIVS